MDTGISQYISDSEIQMTERILLPKGQRFDEEERRKIIRCIDKSIDVDACPGSGKTTVLLAKLIILANRMPFCDNSGICVLTNTNVAVDEIKNRLGEKSDVLFKYPNYFGTIQKFIDKFLGIPMYKYVFKKNVSFIDDNIYRRKLNSLYTEYSKLDRYIFVKCKNKFKNCSNENKRKIKLDYLYNINMKLVSDNIIFTVNGETFLKDETNAKYKEIYDIKYNQLFKNGILKYNDMYLLAQYYIEKFPQLINYFINRFKYVFMDEVQDTKKYQQDILDRIFDNKKCIVQKFGDLNQSIFNDSKNEKIEWNKDKILEIKTSKRYGKNIARYLDKLRVDRLGQLKGNKYIESYPPHLLIYDDSCIGNVKDKFIDIIKEYSLNDNSKYNNLFKAIGWVGQEKEDRITIKSYFPNYNKQNSKMSEYNFFTIMNKAIKREVSIKNIYYAIIEFVIKFLQEIEVKDENDRYYSRTKLLKFLKENHEEIYKKFRIEVIIWTRDIIKSNTEVYDNIKKFIKDMVKIVFKEKSTSIDLDDLLELLFNIDDIEINQESKSNSCNYYIKDDVKIYIDSIHNVKGETHTATLYLETFYKKNDLDRIIDFLLGNYNQQKVKNDTEKTLKMAYVGMSRATTLLCIAVRRDEFMSHVREFKDYGYEVIGCDKDICEEIKINLLK